MFTSESVSVGDVQRHDLVVDKLAGHAAGLVGLLPLAHVFCEGGPVSRLDGINLYVKLAVIDGIHRKDRFLGSRVEREEDLVRPRQARLSLADFESQFFIPAQGLPEDILDRGRKRDSVGGLPPGFAADDRACRHKC